MRVNMRVNMVLGPAHVHRLGGGWGVNDDVCHQHDIRRQHHQRSAARPAWSFRPWRFEGDSVASPGAAQTVPAASVDVHGTPLPNLPVVCSSQETSGFTLDPKFA